MRIGLVITSNACRGPHFRSMYRTFKNGFHSQILRSSACLPRNRWCAQEVRGHLSVSVAAVEAELLDGGSKAALMGWNTKRSKVVSSCGWAAARKLSTAALAEPGAPRPPRRPLRFRILGHSTLVSTLTRPAHTAYAILSWQMEQGTAEQHEMYAVVLLIASSWLCTYFV